MHIHVTNVPLWSTTVMVGEVVCVSQQGIYGNSLFSVQFCCKSKTALKIRLINYSF